MKQETFTQYRTRKNKTDGIKSITQPTEGSALEASNKRIADIWKKTASMTQDEYNATVKTDSTAVKNVLSQQSKDNPDNVGRPEPSWENMDTVKKK